MPHQHGSKAYSQLLIDKARYSLIEEQAKRDGKRTTGLMREIIYECLEFYVDPDLVRKAEEIDNAQWEQSVKNRVFARMKRKAERLAS